MVLITPRLVRPLDPDEVPPLPTRPRSLPAGPDRRRRRSDAPPTPKPEGRTLSATARHGRTRDPQPDVSRLPRRLDTVTPPGGLPP